TSRRCSRGRSRTLPSLRSLHRGPCSRTQESWLQLGAHYLSDLGGPPGRAAARTTPLRPRKTWAAGADDRRLREPERWLPLRARQNDAGGPPPLQSRRAALGSKAFLEVFGGRAWFSFRKSPSFPGRQLRFQPARILLAMAKEASVGTFFLPETQ